MDTIIAAQPATTPLWPTLSFAILIASLALSGYILWRRYQSRRTLVERVAELEALSAAGRAMVESELDVDALCELIAQEMGRVIDNRTFQVGLFRDNLYEILFWQINGRCRQTPQIFDLSENSGIVGWVRDTRKPLLVHDFLKEIESLPARPRYISDSPPRSAIFLPLISGEETLGVVAAQSDRPHHFSEEELRRLMILAHQAGSAIANAQLYEQERRRGAQLELVGQIARQVNAVNDLEEIYQQVVQLTQETFGFHPVNIFAIDPETETAVVQASSAPELREYDAFLERGKGIVGRAILSRETIVSNNVAEDKYFVAHIGPQEIHPAAATQAEIAIPLLVDNAVLGALDVQSPQVGAFSSTEKMALEALAAEVASAIDKAQQVARQQERAWLTTAQLQVAEAVGRTIDLDEIVTAVTRLIPMLVGVSFCGLLLWDEETAVYRGAALYGASRENVRDFKKLRLEIGDWPALDAVHVGQETMTTSRIPLWLKRLPGKKSSPLSEVKLMPVNPRTQMLGVMMVNEFETIPTTHIGHYRFGMRREELLHNIVKQTGQAIENATLRAAQQEEAWVNTALLQVAEAVNSLIELNEILDTIVRLVPMLVGVKSVMILIWDESRQVFFAGPSHGVSTMGRGVIETLEIEPDELPGLPQMADLVTPSVTYSAIHPPPWLQRALEAGRVHLFSLNARGRLVGVMLVGLATGTNEPLSTRRLNILNGIAHQAATAVVNNRLYQEAAERDRLEQEINVAREIQTSLIPDGSPAISGCDVASYWEAARQVSGDFYDFLKLPHGKWGIVIADVADKGVPAALFMALSRTILRTVAFNRQDPAEVLMRVNEIINNDTQSELFVTVFYAVWDPETETITYANGGHNPPLLLRPRGRARLLHGAGIALGVLPKVEIEQRLVHLRPRDTLILYTDGVTEAMNEDFDEFGMERLQLTAEATRKKSAHYIVRAITEGIRHHAGGTTQFDDVTLVVVKRNA